MALNFAGKPFRRGFYCDDTSIRYPYKDSTISSFLLYLYGTGIPLITILSVEFIRFSRTVGGSSRVFPRRNPAGEQDNSNLIEFGWIAYNELIVFVFGALCSQFLTDIAKYSIGRLRPHFIEACRPVGLDTNLCPVTSNNFHYIESYECAAGYESTYKIKDARLSFMSGHSSYAAYTMVFTAVSFYTFYCIFHTNFLSFYLDLYSIQNQMADPVPPSSSDADVPHLLGHLHWFHPNL